MIVYLHPTYGFVAIVFALAIGVAGNYTYDLLKSNRSGTSVENPSPSDWSVKVFRREITEALHQGKIDQALKAVSHIPDGAVRQEECGRILMYVVTHRSENTNEVTGLCSRR